MDTMNRKQKQIVFTVALLVGLLFGQTINAQQTNTVTLRVPNFARPLVEKWVTEYQKTNNEVDFQFVSGKVENIENSITLTTDEEAVRVARFAVLPVTAKGSKAEELTASRRLNATKLKNLFFLDEEEEDEQPKSVKQLHILTGNSQQSASRLYAAHFNEETVNYKGKKISGDDSFLNVAVSRDPFGVTINSLSNIFDLQTRHVRQSLAVLPLDIDKEGRQVFANGSLDDLIRLLEQNRYEEIPVGYVSLSYDQTNAVLSDFVHWVLTEGTQYVHHYGLLGLPEKDMAMKSRD